MKKDIKKSSQKNTPAVHADPFQGFLSLRNSFNDLARDFFEDPFTFQTPALSQLGETSPKVDVTDDGINIVVKADIPGIKDDDIEIEVDEHSITLSGESHIENEKKDKHMYHYERSFGSFSRTLPFPSAVDADSATADLTDGVLTVILPKLNKTKKKSVKISKKK